MNINKTRLIYMLSAYSLGLIRDTKMPYGMTTAQLVEIHYKSLILQML